MPAEILNLMPTFVLVFFRIGGMMIFAPFFGSSRIPRRLKAMIALVLAASLASTVPPINLPAHTWELTLGIAGELAFGIALGMALSFTFIAAQWAGEIVGQQMGMNLSEVFDPQFGNQSTLIGDLYFMLTLVVFLIIRGHHAMLIGLRHSFDALPLLSVGVDMAVFSLLVGLFQSCAMLALQLAAPMLVTMLVVDVALGFIGKTMPQFNVMTAGLSMRSGIGLCVIVVGIGLTSDVITGALIDSLNTVQVAWTTPGE
jgi:flagellar biosynthesis protein FliR